jgi:2-(1,2-epoxy-1,2-dihydrophenyl)acetyl-CoA isomerase
MASFELQAEAERKAIMACGEHPDGWEGVGAFIEKRKPEFNR